METKTYELILGTDGLEGAIIYVAIKCLKCGLISNNPNDVAMTYCSACHIFHDDKIYEKLKNNPAVGVKPPVPTSVILAPNLTVSYFDKDENSMAAISPPLFVIWLEWMENHGINPMEIGTIEIMGPHNTWLYLKPVKTEEGRWNYSVSKKQ